MASSQLVASIDQIYGTKCQKVVVLLAVTSVKRMLVTWHPSNVARDHDKWQFETESEWSESPLEKPYHCIWKLTNVWKSLWQWKQTLQTYRLVPDCERHDQTYRPRVIWCRRNQTDSWADRQTQQTFTDRSWSPRSGSILQIRSCFSVLLFLFGQIESTQWNVLLQDSYLRSQKSKKKNHVPQPTQLFIDCKVCHIYLCWNSRNNWGGENTNHGVNRWQWPEGQGGGW